MVVPVIPTLYSVAVFVLLCLLLVQKEVMRALGRTENRKWSLFTNSVLGLLLVVYGVILLSRFLNLLR